MSHYSLFLSLLIFFSVVRATAQDDKFSIPDINEIEKSSKDSISSFYFPKLFERYKKCDTTLSEEEYKYLYYGYRLRDEYSSYSSSFWDDTVRLLFKKAGLTTTDL